MSNPIIAPPPPPKVGTAELLSELNKIPLFMTELSDEGLDTNADLEALRALAYEGTRADVAENFKTQGNDCVKIKKWVDAREFYNKGLAVLKGRVEGVIGSLELGSGVLVGGEGDEKVVDIEVEERREKALEEVLYVNRSLCNLELKNYGSVTRDCAAALRLNPSSIKALYRSALACLSLTKLPAALDACNRALTLDPTNTAIQALHDKIEARQSSLQKYESEKTELENREKFERVAVKVALKDRGIHTSGPMEAEVEMNDARIALEDPLDAGSTLRFPVLLVYPLAAQTDLLGAVRETETLGYWLNEVFPIPWDRIGEYRLADVDCYMDTVSGGLVKAGKKVTLGKVLVDGKVEVSYGLIRCYVVPKKGVKGWVEEFKKRKGK